MQPFQMIADSGLMLMCFSHAARSYCVHLFVGTPAFWDLITRITLFRSRYIRDFRNPLRNSYKLWNLQNIRWKFKCPEKLPKMEPKEGGGRRPPPSFGSGRRPRPFFGSFFWIFGGSISAYSWNLRKSAKSIIFVIFRGIWIFIGDPSKSII